MKINYQPYRSSWAITHKSEHLSNNGMITTKENDSQDLVTEAENVNKTLHATKGNSPELPNVHEINFQNENIGIIFNTYEQLILNSKWDVRESGDYATLILGRNHMFYTYDGVPISDIKNLYDSTEEISISLKPNLNPVNFLSEVNYTLVNELNAQDLYDSATYRHYEEGEKKINDVDLKKSLFRDGVRKISENHFAISGFNLIYNEIKTDNDVVNTISANYKNDKSINNYISVINTGEIKDEYIKNKVIQIPDIDNINYEKTSSKLLPHNEYLGNLLLKELEYCYSGKIFIKYNPSIEISDTITLLDEINSIYGIFRVDSFEHVLDKRGLITIANVKACWDLKDPTLDLYSNKIGYEIIEELKNKIKMDETMDQPKNVVIKNIVSSYMRLLIQSPKYTLFYNKKSTNFLNKEVINDSNFYAPSVIPLKFMPMINKGKIQIPKSLKYAFFYAPDSLYSIMFQNISARFQLAFQKFVFNIKKGLSPVFYFLLDFIISIPTFNLHEFFKPILGIRYSQAISSTFTEEPGITSNELESMQTYNPYTGNGKKQGDLSIAFFNIQMREISDLYEATKENVEKIKKSITAKENQIINMANNLFDCTLLVELYDSYNKENIDGLNGYNYKTFINTLNINGAKTEGPFTIFKEENKSTEYGVCVNNISSKFSYTNQVKVITGMDRNIVETTFDISSLGYKNLSLLKVIWFHNIYGNNKYSDSDFLEKRKNNIRAVIDSYSNESKEYGVIIMADCNLEICNYGTKPKSTSGSGVNSFMVLEKDSVFKQMIDKPTTLGKTPNTYTNIYDNVLLSKNLQGIAMAKRYDYSSTNKNIISDHLPVYVTIKRNPR